MNIWLINHYAVPPKYYPLARQTNFAKHLMAMGHTVTIFAASTVHNTVPMQNLITDGAPYREITEDGVHYVLVRCRNYEGNGLSRIYNMCEFAWKLPGVCKRFPKPDAMVSTSMPPMSCGMGVRLGKKWGCKSVAEIADLWPESIVAYGIAGPHNPAVIALRRLEKWIYKTADAVIFTMEGAYDYIMEQGWEKEVPRSKVHFINNGVDLEAFDYNRAHFPVDDPDLSNPDIFKVVYTGSIRRVNNLGLLLDVAKEIKDPRVKFLIWGGGELEALQKRVADEKITNVVFKGLVEKQYIPSIVSRADVNILHGNKTPMLRFGISPNKLFDYFAAEKPVLSDLGKKNDLVEQYGAGITVDTTEELPTAIEQLLEMPDEMRLKMCAKVAEAAKAYSFKVLTQHFLQIIESV